MQPLLVKIKINVIELYVSLYTPSLEQQTLLSKQIVNETPTEFQYIEGFFYERGKYWEFMDFWNRYSGKNYCSICVIVGFQQSDRQHDQNLNNDTSYRPPVTSAQCIIGTEKYPDSCILLNYDDGDYSQVYGQI